MAVNINADTTTGLQLESDTSGNINIQNDGTTVVAVTSSGAAVTGTLSATGGFSFDGANISTQPTFRNRIINGAMVIDQRNAGASLTPTTGAFTVDRWAFYPSQASKFTIQQNQNSVTPPAGFINYLGFTVASAVSIGSGDYFTLEQPIEGFNVADLDWGKSTAKTVTLSFWVRSSLTGTFGGALYNSAGTYSYAFNYTISSANTWEQKTITITGPTTGTFNTNNAASFIVTYSLGVGSTYSGTAGTWAASNLRNATGSVSVVGTNGATFYITGVQLEAGSSATDFETRPYDVELTRCQRYYINYGYPFSTPVAGSRLGSGSPFSSTSAYLSIGTPCKMRATPSVSGQMNLNSNGFSASVSSFGSIHSDSGVITLEAVSSAIPTTQPVMLRFNTTTDYLRFNAEL